MSLARAIGQLVAILTVAVLAYYVGRAEPKHTWRLCAVPTAQQAQGACLARQSWRSRYCLRSN